MQKCKPGRMIELRVNGALLTAIKTENAVAADYISFMETVTKALMDPEVLECEANASGKTILHSVFKTFGSMTISNPRDPQ